MIMLLPEQWKSFVTMVIGKVNVTAMEIPFCPSNQKGHFYDSLVAMVMKNGKSLVVKLWELSLL